MVHVLVCVCVHVCVCVRVCDVCACGVCACMCVDVSKTLSFSSVPPPPCSMELGLTVPQVLSVHVQTLQTLQSGQRTAILLVIPCVCVCVCVCVCYNNGTYSSHTHQLLELCDGNQGNQIRRHTCLLMSAAACLQMAREAQEDEEKVCTT